MQELSRILWLPGLVMRNPNELKSYRGILQVPNGNDSNGSLLPPGHACSHWQCITCELHPQNSSLAPSAEVFACEQAPVRCTKHMWSIPCFFLKFWSSQLMLAKCIVNFNWGKGFGRCFPKTVRAAIVCYHSFTSFFRKGKGQVARMDHQMIAMSVCCCQNCSNKCLLLDIAMQGGLTPWMCKRHGVSCLHARVLLCLVAFGCLPMLSQGQGKPWDAQGQNACPRLAQQLHCWQWDATMNFSRMYMHEVAPVT